MISEGIETIQVTRKKKDRLILPDLMASNNDTGQPATKWLGKPVEHQIVPEKQEPSLQDAIKNYKKPEKKRLISPSVVPDPPKKEWQRPPAEYSNSKSLYGIDYNDL